MADENKVYESEQEEILAIKQRLDIMGIKYHPSTGLEKLRAKLQESLEENPNQVATADAVIKKVEKKAAAKEETLAERNNRMRLNANRLVRVRITCMDATKKDVPGEFFSVCNSAIGSIKKFIPFHQEEPYHVPIAIINVLKEKQHQTMVKIKRDGKEVKRSKLVRTFAIEELPPLTPKELNELKAKQAATQSIED